MIAVRLRPSDPAPGLADRQAALQEAITGGPLPGGLLMAGDAARLDVYRQAYTTRLLAALRDNYEVLVQAMGDAQFDALGRAYIAAHPSPHRSIRWFGDRLAEFMAGAYAARLPHPAMVDLARMDWAMRHAFDAPGAAPLQAEMLQSLSPDDWPGLVLRLQPSAQMLELEWAIEPAWHALAALEPGAQEPELPAPQPHAHRVLVWRQGLQTRWRAPDGFEGGLILRLQAGESFAGLCAHAAAAVGADDAAAAVVRCLQQWIADGLLAAP